MKELKYWIAFSEMPGIGIRSRKRLLKYYHHPRKFFEDRNNSIQLKKLGRTTLTLNEQHGLLNMASRKAHLLRENGHIGIDIGSKNYPFRLKQCPDAPTLLYSAGIDYSWSNHYNIIGIVGTRKPTLEAKISCRKLIYDLVAYDPIIVSGLAEGIDTIALRTALECNLKVIAVLAHGLEKVYPNSNRLLAEKIKEIGMLFTEFTSGSKLSPHNFPQRNRIIAGLSDAIVVVQSNKTGGSMITANFANEYNREVFTFPGNIENLKYSGCNHLIKTHRAHLITSAKDIAYNMGWNTRRSSSKQNGSRIIELLQSAEIESINNLSEQIKMDKSSIRKKILQLELEGSLENIPGNRYFHTQKVA